MYDAVIVGAGPSGLTAAYKLTRDGGLRVAVLEADPQHLGGISRTQEHNGYRFDIGGHRFFTKSQEVQDLWDTFLPHDMLERPRKSRILYNGKLFAYPLDALQAFAKLGPVESARCIASYLHARIRPIRNPRSFHDWVRNQFGERLYRTFFKTYTEKVWGISCDELSADWAAQRIKGLSFREAAIDGLKRSFGLSGRGGAKAKTLIESFRYPRLGPGMMWDAAGERVRENGGEIHMGTRAVSYSYDAERGVWTVRAQTTDGENVTYQAPEILCSAPLRDTVKTVEPTPRCADAADDLKYRDFLSVTLMLAHPPAFDDTWIYVHDPSVDLGRVQNFGAWSPDMLPSADVGCLGLEYFCNAGDALWEMSDEALVAKAETELRKIGLLQGNAVTDGLAIRQPKTYPVYDGAYKRALARIRTEFVDVYPGFQAIGRNGLHAYNNQDHAMMTGILAAENVMLGERRYDPWQVNQDAEYHEEGGTNADRVAALRNIRDVPERKDAA